MNVETALRGYTVNAAYAGHEDGRTGRIRVGMLADLAVLSQDLFTIDPMEIHKTVVDLTMFDGRVIHQR